MSKQPMQATGDPADAASPDGVNDQAEHGAAGEGSAYPNPHSGKKPEGFSGGQTMQEYHGSHKATDLDADGDRN